MRVGLWDGGGRLRDKERLSRDFLNFFQNIFFVIYGKIMTDVNVKLNDTKIGFFHAFECYESTKLMIKTSVEPFSLLSSLLKKIEISYRTTISTSKTLNMMLM